LSNKNFLFLEYYCEILHIPSTFPKLGKFFYDNTWTCTLPELGIFAPYLIYTKFMQFSRGLLDRRHRKNQLLDESASKGHLSVSRPMWLVRYTYLGTLHPIRVSLEAQYVLFRIGNQKNVSTSH